MITFTELGSYGRLGNQLFQFAALKSLSLEKGFEITLPILKNKEWHGQKCLLNELSIDEKQSNKKGENSFYEKDGYSFDPEFFTLNDNTNIQGFFQHKSYYEKNLDLLRKKFKLRNNEPVKEKFKGFDGNRENSTIVSLHVRLGDILENNTYINSPFLSEQFKFLANSIDYFGGNCDFLIFVGGSRNSSGYSDNDKELVKNLLQSKKNNLIFSEGNDTLTDFELMKLCDHHILSPLSTFSLWVGYLADEDKTVVVNQDFFLKTKNSDSDSLYLENWKKI